MFPRRAETHHTEQLDCCADSPPDGTIGDAPPLTSPGEKTADDGPDYQSEKRKHHSSLHSRYIRRVLGLHADDVVAGIDVVDFAGDAAGKVAQQV